MKNYKLTLAVLAMAALVSCQENEFHNDAYKPAEGEVLFKVTNYSKATKSAETIDVVKAGPILIGSVGGHNLYLEETVTRLDDLGYAPETKGTPGYTQNFHKLYGGFNAAVYQVGATSAYEEDGRFDPVDEDKLIYKRKYGNDLWDASKGIYFFLHAGEGDGGLTGITNLPGGYNASTGTITFDYDASDLASEGKILASSTKDILFTSRKVTSEEEYKLLISKNSGIPVLFHHIFSGVKFAIGNSASDDDVIKINSVTLSGLYDTGHCVVTPRSEKQPGEEETYDYIDNPADYSSAGTSVWSGQGYSTSKPSYFSGTFGTPYTFSNGSNGGSFNSKGNYPGSFSAAGNERNLNDNDATQTFWFIPQSMGRANEADHVILSVNVTDGEGTYDFDIDLTDILVNTNGKAVYWHAGEIRTYTITIDYVNVQIDDEVTIASGGTAANGYTGSYKDNVVIKNTGNTDAYIRAALVGQWLTDAGDPVFGFTDEVYALKEVNSWYQDQFVTGEYDQGIFTGLAGYNGAGNTLNNWFYNSTDGYYYYTAVVHPDEATGENGVNEDGTLIHDPLFTSYTINNAPNTQIAAMDVAIHFELEIATQAVAANGIDGKPLSWQDAWKKALGYDPVVGPATTGQ